MHRVPLPQLQEGEFLLAAGETHRGLVKSINQDAIGVWGPAVPRVEQAGAGYIFCVADGMGGEPGGEIAARMTTATLVEYYRDPCGAGPDDLAALLAEAHRRVCARQRVDPAIPKMGAVVSCLWVAEDAIEVIHAGDTRVYGVGAGRIEQLTVDEVGTFGGITNYVGMSEPFGMTRRAVAYEDWDLLVVCSDGLPKHVSDARILEIAMELEDPDRVVQGLLREALAGGGTDNVSVVCVELC
jgi:protein phosphatase